MSLRYLFLDMNSYFASVEQLDRPSLRGKPVAVVPMMGVESTSVLAASYEAKRYHVKTGTLVREARIMCPGITFLQARADRYIYVHKLIKVAVESCLHVSAVKSIDEMVCELRGDDQKEGTAIALAHDIKNAIRKRAGESLTCSVGLGPNRVLAKIAADMQKPDGLTIIRKEELPERLHVLKLDDVPGIGPRMKKRMHQHGILTMANLLALDEKYFSLLWNSKLLGWQWYHLLRGEDIPEKKTRHSVVGHSRVLPPSMRNDASSRAMLMRLIHKAAARLRHEGHAAGSMHLWVQYFGKLKWVERKKFPHRQDTLTFLELASEMWQNRIRAMPLKVGVTFSDLLPANHCPVSLFEEDTRQKKLSSTIDYLNHRFGINAIYFGGMHQAKSENATRIAFHTIPDTQLHDP